MYFLSLILYSIFLQIFVEKIGVRLGIYEQYDHMMRHNTTGSFTSGARLYIVPVALLVAFYIPYIVSTNVLLSNVLSWIKKIK